MRRGVFAPVVRRAVELIAGNRTSRECPVLHNNLGSVGASGVTTPKPAGSPTGFVIWVLVHGLPELGYISGNNLQRPLS